MNQYSEVIGSFLRRGSFPLEADYVFSNEQALLEYYNKPENKVILHKGLLKIVEDDGNGQQALYWVSTVNGELQFTKLISGLVIEDIQQQLEDLNEKLNKEIQDRIDSDKAIWGTDDPTNLPDDLNSILDLSNAIKNIQTELEKVEKLEEEVKALAGTNEDVLEYLKTLDYKSLTEVSEKLHSFFDSTNSINSEIDTWVELQNFLEGVSDNTSLLKLLENYLGTIYGNPLPSEEFLTLRGIEDFVRILKSSCENNIESIKQELNSTQSGVGLDGDGKYSPDFETYYLKSATSVMNALKILDSKIREVAVGLSLEVENNDVINLAIRNEKTRTVISGDLLISTEDNNGIQKKNDGIYLGISSTYEDGILTIRVNNKIISQHVLGLSSLVENAYYDPDRESIVITFKLIDNSTQEVIIPVSSLIREWTIDNSIPDKVVELERIEDYTSGADKLSADIRIFSDKYNILTKRGNTLYVEGKASNIVHNDIKVSEILDELKSSSSEGSEKLDNLEQKLELHLENIDNPHKTTAEQVGTYTKEKIDDLLEKKADLVNGIVPEDQLPKLSWIEVI